MIKVRFKLRETSSKKHFLYCMVRANKQPAKSLLSTGISVDKKDWDSKRQIIKPVRLRIYNDRLEEIRKELEDTFLFLSKKLPKSKVTGEAVKRAYQNNENPSISLTQTYERYFEFLEDQKNRNKIFLSDVTLKTYRLRANYIRKYLTSVIKKPDFSLFYTDEEFMDQLYDYGTKEKGDSHNHLMKIFQLLKRIVAFAKKKGWIEYNSTELYPIRFKRDKRKKFLTWEELEQIKNHEFGSDVLNKTRDIFIAQCWSGMAYFDFSTFDFKQDTFISRGILFISKTRKKTMENSILPLFPEFKKILVKYDYKLPIYSNQAYNRYLKEIGAILGFKLKLTTHVARKTAGNLWLNNGVKMEVVSKMLGHKSIKITEQIYAAVNVNLVYEETKHLL